MVNTGEYVVTPWEVKGDVNYDKLIQEFGTYPITDQIMNKIENTVANNMYLLVRYILFIFIYSYGLCKLISQVNIY